MGNQLLFFFSAIGVFNGLFASFYLLFFNKKNRLPNYFLGILILMLSIRIGKSVYLIFNENSIRLYLQIGLSACFMIGVMLYYYMKASVNLVKKVPRSWKLHIGFLLAFIIGVGIVIPYEDNSAFWGNYFIDFIYFIWGTYIVLTGFVIKKITIKFLNNKKDCATTELWLLVVFVANLLIYVGYIVGRMKWYIVGALTFSLVMYILIFFLLSKKNREGVFQDLPEKYRAKKIEKTAAQLLNEALLKLMIEDKWYKNPKLKLKDVAVEINSTPHQVSQLLNENLNKSFAVFVNEFRIKEAKELLKTNRHYTLEGIGFEAGFSSKSSFYATFKKVVGITPAQYKKQLD